MIRDLYPRLLSLPPAPVSEAMRDMARWFEARGVSPVIGTVLMIAIVVALSAVVMTFFTGFGAEDFQDGSVTVHATEGGDYVMEVMSMGSSEKLEIRCGDASSAATETGETASVRGECTTVAVVGIAGSAQQTMYSSPTDDLRVVSGSAPSEKGLAGHVADQPHDYQCTEEWDGSGTASDPYQISNDWELQCIYYAGLAYNEDGIDYLDAHYEQVNDIDASRTDEWELDYWNDSDIWADSDADGVNVESWEGGTGWIPIGNTWEPFTGTFNGNGYTISGLTANHHGDGDEYSRGPGVATGVFGNIQDGAHIHDVNLTDITITGNGYVGTLVGQAVVFREKADDADGNYNEALTIEMRDAWLNNGQSWPDDINPPRIENVTVSNSSVTTVANRAGGLVGSINHGVEIRNADADVDVDGNQYVGGLVGYIGGLYGGGTVIDSHASGDVGRDHLGGGSGAGRVGGLAGYNHGTILSSTATGAVDGAGNGNRIGGFVGATDVENASKLNDGEYTEYTNSKFYLTTPSITQSSAAGDVVGGGNYLGGFVGDHSGGSIETAAVTGTVLPDIDRRGGFLGIIGDGTTVRDTYTTDEDWGRFNWVYGEDNTPGDYTIESSYYQNDSEATNSLPGTQHRSETQMSGYSARSNMEFEWDNWDITRRYPVISAISE